MFPFRRCLMAACFLALAGSGGRAVEPMSDFHITATLHIGGSDRWDYIIADPQTHLLFVPRQSHTQVIDPAKGQVIADIADTPKCHGVALAAEFNRGFISDSKGATVFDLKTFKPLGTIAAGKGSDAIIYDPASENIIVLNGGSHDATFIAAGSDLDSPKTSTIALGKPEFAAADSRGRVYVNLEDTAEVAVLDAKNPRLITRWKIDHGEEPSGMAIDAINHHLFIGCHNKTMAVVDTQSGKTIANVPIGAGIDACAFDLTAEAFASCGDGTITLIKETAPGQFEPATIKTRPGARTMTIDTGTHTLYLPDAETLPPATAPAGGGRGRPMMKPDSFFILVPSRQAATADTTQN